MLTWKALWCFYNSTVLKSFSTLGLLGAISIVIPALINLPAKRDFSPSGLKTPIINYNSLRNWTHIFGRSTIIYSLATPFVYLNLLYKLNWETCDIKLNIISNEVFLQLLFLYILTTLVLLFFGLFYLKWQETLRIDKELGSR
jgi:hypothetical protein